MILRIVGLLLLFSNLWLLPVGLSQNLHFRHFTKEQGLASNNVRCILQDRQGYLWIGTANGLSRYDGYQFVNYVNRQDDTTSISDNYINAISQDRQGYIWVGTNNALNSFNPLTRKFNHYGLHREVGSEGDARISAIYVDMHDNVWAGTRFGLLHLDRTAGQIKEYPIDSSIRSFPYFEISAITEAPHLQSGDLVIGTWGMGTYLFDKEKSLYQPIVLQDLSLPVWINQLFKDPAGNVWAAANSASLYQLDAPKNQFVIKRADSDTPGRDLHSIFINKEGSVLVGRGGQGFSIIENDLKVCQDYLVHNDLNDLHANWVKTIYQDREGGVWMGKLSEGLSYFLPKTLRFKVFRHTDDPRSLTDDMVSCVLETRSGEIWAGTRRHGINIKAPGDIGFKHLTIDNSGLPSNEIIALHQDKNDNIWIGTWGQGLVIFNPQDKTWHHFEPDENDSLAILSRFVADIFEASDGNVWLATVKGISVLDSDNWAKGKFKNYSHHPQEPNSLSFPRVSAIHQDRSGNIWVGTLGGGLDLYDPVHNQFVHHRHDPYDPLSLSNEQVNAIFEDSQGRVWVGTFGGGLNLLHKDHSGFRHFNTVDGLANDEVMGIVNDGKGQLWVATGRGLSVLNLDELTFNNIYAYDGLSGNEMLERSIYYSERTGTIYCGSRSGLTIIDPNALSQNNVVPNIVIQSVQKYDEHGIPVEEDIFRGPATDELFLTHADNIITIEFVALSFSHPQENQYAYKLEGVNDDWIQLGSKREVTFTSLPPGEYQFQVIGSNNDQIWNTGGAQLTIFVSPPWWNTWWAWTLLAVLVGLVIYFLIRYRDSRHAEIEESRRLKYLNDAMSEFIATVSHELRTPLTSIMGFSKLVKKRLTERIYPFADLTDTKREQTAQQVISNMDIVILESERLTALINEVLDLARIEAGKVEWNLEVVSLDEIIHQAGEATETIFLAKQMHLDIYVEPDLPGIYADRNRLLQVLINLFSNSVKFSDGNCVECRAYSNGAYVEVSIKDSGIGIRKEDLSTIFEKFGQVKGGHNLSKPGGSGLGLPISREIIEHHGGKIWVVSTVGEGSVFYFTLPVIKKASLLQIND